ncbi:SAM hydrolase/SAM-dependent halogenase family protein [Natrarchaeobius chitinivorans]|uniref:NAD operon protein n=1 Tax=Natrarchaeobius chitinivorans TaxID=1679083 RepID=A0A3N6MT61_NATCH|nr:SAM-dependent chlorinase/fluorinase [Natrarchaeobius chitinivorans]RQG97976.1 NAD operon protein [Natrarchaeobius chitinivorans]
MITLASDFDTPYPAAMKGVILRRTETRLVDVAHDFPRQDVRTAAFWLREVLPYFPPATHLVVVDPGVGTDRDALVVRAGDHVLVGPDNGVLVPAARRLAPDGIDAYGIDESRLESVEPTGETRRPGRADTAAGNETDDDGPASNTFHGRDVFAPAAAAVHEADPGALESVPFLEPAAEYVDRRLPEATVDDDRARGEVLVVDGFGNVITNVPGEFLAGRRRLVANGEAVPIGETFGSVPEGDRLATVGSHGYVELDVNHGRGDEAFGLEVGDRVDLEAERS